MIIIPCSGMFPNVPECSGMFHVPGFIGRDPFDQNFRKFRYKIKWNRTFLEIRFENCGQPPEVVLFSGNLEIPEISCSICHFYSVRIDPSSFSREKLQDGGE